MRFTVSVFLGLALLLLGNIASAQDEAKKKEGWDYFFLEEVLQRSCDDPTLRSAIALPQPKLILDVTDEGETKVKARVGMELGKKVVLSLDVASPRKSKSEEETTLASLDGLSRGGTADLSLSWYQVPWDSKKYKDKYTSELDKLEKIAEESKAGGDKVAESAGAQGSQAADAWTIADYANPLFERPSAVAALGQDSYKEAMKEYRRWMRGEKINVPVFTLRGHAEEKGFDFFVPSPGPPSGLKKTSESHTDWKITGSAGRYVRGSVYLSLNYNRGTKFEKGAEKDFCAPSGLAGVLQCQTLPIAPPEKKRTETLEFEGRGLAGNLVGLAVYLTRDLRDNFTTIEVPVYLLQKFKASKMELNLGARAQWQSATNDLTISVFVGPALSTVLRMKKK
jgi:hypothetical protein